MNRPHIVCHMVMSIDGKVTGDFLYRPECENATNIYYEINRNYKAEGFICGRVTMEGSFTNGWYPDLSQYEPLKHDMDLKMDSIVVAVVRKFVLLLPLIYIMPNLLTDKTKAVYMAEPVADIIAVTFTAILFTFQFKKALKEITEV